jgi:hypothetical protein
VKVEYLVVFTEELHSIKFLDSNGQPADPRILMLALAEGVAKVTYDKTLYDGPPSFLKYETWKVVLEIPQYRILSPTVQKFFDDNPDAESWY